MTITLSVDYALVKQIRFGDWSKLSKSHKLTRRNTEVQHRVFAQFKKVFALSRPDPSQFYFLVIGIDIVLIHQLLLHQQFLIQKPITIDRLEPQITIKSANSFVCVDFSSCSDSLQLICTRVVLK